MNITAIYQLKNKIRAGLAIQTMSWFMDDQEKLTPEEHEYLMKLVDADAYRVVKQAGQETITIEIGAA